MSNLSPKDLAASAPASTDAAIRASQGAPDPQLGSLLPAGAKVADLPQIAQEVPAKSKRSAGRNLPAAISVGLLMGAVLLISLYLWPSLFLFVVIIAVVIASLEVSEALDNIGLRVPTAPLIVASIGVVISTSVYGPRGMLAATIASVLILMTWRATESTGLMAVRDTVSSIFTFIWVPFMASFAVLLFNLENGSHLIIFAIAVPVANDVGGYIFGVFLGKHPMAPSISPKKSWEGFFGSLLAGVLTAALLGKFLLPEIGMIAGIIFGIIMVIVATSGDLCESLIKRDLGVKDMGRLLPGHGGMMDRLDSLLLTAPTLYVLLAIMELINV